ncbi:retrovirus-related pol polyprotein from transposon TNT 1-94 [Tanacetum coccineum]
MLILRKKKKASDTTTNRYDALNQLYKDFPTRFVPQTELSAEQAFWSQNSVNSLEPTLPIRPTNVEVPKELLKVSMVNTSLKKLKHHLANFDVVVKERTTPTAITEGSWGFKHTKACFMDEIIPFVKALKNLFSTFNQHLVDELSEVQNVFYQMEQAMEQHRIESKTFEKLDNQLKQEIFQRKNSVSNQSVPSFDQLFELNELKAQSQEKDTVVQIVLWYLDSGYSKHVDGDSLLRSTNLVSIFWVQLNSVMIMLQRLWDMGDYQIRNVIISRVYYVEGLGHNLFSTGLVRGLPKLKVWMNKGPFGTAYFCALGKSLKKPHKPKSEDTNQEKLYLLYMDLCGPMHVVSVNGNKYILVIVEDYSRFTWVKCLRSKDEAPTFIINFLKMIQKGWHLSHESSGFASPQQNGVVERRNRKLIEAARTMLSYAKAPLFLWAEAVATACYTQNRSMIRRRHDVPDIIVETFTLTFDKMTALALYIAVQDLYFMKMNPLCYHLLHQSVLDSCHTLILLHRLLPPSRTDSGYYCFQPLFDEFLNPSTFVLFIQSLKVVVPINEVIAPVLADSTGSPSSTIVDQDAPSPKFPSDQSSSSDSYSLQSVHPCHQILNTIANGTKVHPLGKHNRLNSLDKFPLGAIHERSSFLLRRMLSITAVEPKDTNKDALDSFLLD